MRTFRSTRKERETLSVQNNIVISDAVTRIISSFATRDTATVEEVLALARQLPAALAKSETAPVPAAEVAAPAPAVTARPAVPIDRSVSDETVTCLCCGRSFTMLKRHLKAEHGLTEAEYRSRFQLPEDHPLVAPNYSIRKAEYAKRIGLGKYTRDDSNLQDAR